MIKFLLLVSTLFTMTIYANCADSITQVHNNLTFENAYEIHTQDFKWEMNNLTTSTNNGCDYQTDWYKIRISHNNRLSAIINFDSHEGDYELDIEFYNSNKELIANNPSDFFKYRKHRLFLYQSGKKWFFRGKLKL